MVHFLLPGQFGERGGNKFTHPAFLGRKLLYGKSADLAGIQRSAAQNRWMRVQASSSAASDVA